MDETVRSSGGSRLSAGQWVAVVLTVLAAVFVIENRGRVEIEFLLITIRSPMWLVLLVVFAVGWLSGMLFRRVRR